jgi:hypothetical protein
MEKVRELLGKKAGIGEFFLFALSIITLSSVFPAAQVLAGSNLSNVVYIGRGLFYHEKSSIAQWYAVIPNSTKDIYAENVKIYEAESEMNREYFAERNAKIMASMNSTTEPPFDRASCWRNGNPELGVVFCSCGDGFCASYEDKCKCPDDCGTCPDDTVCKRGYCVEFVPDTCMNTICETGENETCPWDCGIHMIPAVEEIRSSEEIEASKERAKEHLREFVESHGEEYIETNETQKDVITLEENPE